MAVIKMNFLSQALGMQTNVTICIPSASFADRMSGRENIYVQGMKYQTLWLLHGGTGDDSDYVNFSNIVRYADDHKLAVVMPADYNASYSDDPSGSKYYTFIVDELPKLCRAFFPLSDKREDNFIAGLSMGAGGTFKCAIAHPEMYAAALCMSGGGRGPVWSKEDRPQTPPPKFAGAEPSGENDPWNYAKAQIDAGRDMPKFFFTCGLLDEAALIDSRTTSLRLEQLGYDVYREDVEGYRHEWDFWDQALRKAIKDWLPIRHNAIYPGE